MDNIEGSFIHEDGHYIYEQLFRNNAKPLAFDAYKNFTSSHLDELNNPYKQEGWVYKFFYDETYIKTIKSILSKTLEYENVARKPIEMAARILKMDTEDLAQYTDSNDLAEYFKDHSIIDIFLLNAVPGFDDIHVLDNIYNIYLSYLNRDSVLFENINCPASAITTYNPYEADKMDMQSMLRWVMEEFLPQVVESFKLSTTQIFFLERMADYVNRGTHILSEKGREEDDYERLVELTVRGQEFRVIANMEAEIIDSFAGLEQIHIKTASPRICDFILSSEVASLSFDGEMIGETYTCLSL